MTDGILLPPTLRERKLRALIHFVDAMKIEWKAELEAEPGFAEEWHALRELECASRDLFDAAGCAAIANEKRGQLDPT